MQQEQPEGSNNLSQQPPQKKLEKKNSSQGIGEPSFYGNANSLASIWNGIASTCNDITRNSRECPTLIRRGTKRGGKEGQGEVNKYSSMRATLYRLQHQVVDYESALYRLRKRRKRRSTNSPNTTTTSNSNDTHDNNTRLLHRKLVNESLRLQQQDLLVTRMNMAIPALQTAFPDAFPDDEELNNNNNNNNSNARQTEVSKTAETFLRQEALRNRNDQIQRSLSNCRILEELRRKQSEAYKKSQVLHKRNQELWTIINQRKQQQQTSSISTFITTAPQGEFKNQAEQGEDEKSSKMKMENILLRGTLQDIIVGCNLPWHNNKSLFQLLSKLESGEAL